MTRNARRVLASMCCLLWIASLASAYDCAPRGGTNGIVVAAPKVYDYQALRTTLETLVARLSTAPPLLDITKVSDALSHIQGSSMSHDYLAIQVQIAPLVAGTSPTPPQVTEPKADPGLQPTAPTGLGAHDLLSSQLELTYRVANLRLLLEESNDDRYLTVETAPIPGSGTPAKRGTRTSLRGKTVLGFQISVGQAPRNAVAEIGFTVDVSAGPHQAPAVVQLFPQDKTYNVSRLTSNSKQLGLGAVAQLVGLGAQIGSRRADVYLLRDTDTVALLQRPPTGQCSFAWQFRPVLGAKTVTSGTREVYAALALPVAEGSDCHLKVTGWTCWRKFDPKTKAVGNEIAGTRRCLDVSPVLVLARAKLDSDCRPEVTNVTVYDAGSGQVGIVLEGKQMLQNTALAVGHMALRETDTLLRCGVGRLSCQVPLALLAECPLQFIQRYGTVFPACRLQEKEWDKPPYTLGNTAVAQCSPTQAKVTLTLLGATGDSIERQLPWAVTLGLKVFAFGDLATEVVDAGITRLSFRCDNALLRGEPFLRAGRLGLGPVYQVSHQLTAADWKPYPLLAIDGVGLLAENATDRTYAVVGEGFDAANLHLLIGSEAANLEEVTPTFVRARVSKTAAAGAQEVLACREGCLPVAFALMAPKTPPPTTPATPTKPPATSTTPATPAP